MVEGRRVYIDGEPRAEPLPLWYGIGVSEGLRWLLVDCEHETIP
jgi:hypothetical protein